MVHAPDTELHAEDGQRGLPLRDVLIGIYAAYYMGSQDSPVKDHLNAHFNLRAKNSFNMQAAMEHAFGKPDSPWIVLDHLSDKRRDPQNKGQPLHGAHFLTIYHRDTQRVMVVMPGLESDDNLGDTMMDLQQMTIGGMRGQSAALYRYMQDVEQKIAREEFKDAAGQPLPVTGKPMLGAHSMGCTAAQMMVLEGYKAVLVEPRPVHDGLIRRIVGNHAHITGKPDIPRQAALEQLDKGSVNIRSLHANVWNSVILPWVRQREVGQNFGYSTVGHKVSPADRGITTFHRVEMSVPSINGIEEAKGYEANSFVKPADGQRRNLISDILHNNKRKP